MYKLVTCPETAHLELIDYEDHPLGMLVQACSQFRPACAMTCTRTCAARLDLRNRVRPLQFECDELEVEVTSVDVLALR
jgi:hypothetical protein